MSKKGKRRRERARAEAHKASDERSPSSLFVVHQWVQEPIANWPKDAGTIVLDGLRPPEEVGQFRGLLTRQVHVLHEWIENAPDRLPHAAVVPLAEHEISLPADKTCAKVRDFTVWRSTGRTTPIAMMKRGDTVVFRAYWVGTSSIVFEMNGKRVELGVGRVAPSSVPVAMLRWRPNEIGVSYGHRVEGKPAVSDISSKGLDFDRMREDSGVVVRDLKSGVEDFLGSPGVELLALPIWEGEHEYHNGHPDATTIIEVDLPFLLPMAEDTYDVGLRDGTVAFTHLVKKRGAQRFSSLDVTNLPRFSHLSIAVRGFEDGLVLDDGKLVLFSEVIPRNGSRGSMPPLKGWPTPRSYRLICDLLDKLVQFSAGDLAHLRPRLSFVMRVVASDNTTRAWGTVPIAGQLVVTSSPVARHDRRQWELFAKAASALRKTPATTAGSFIDRIFAIVHDFCFYCRQHPEVLGELDEEMIRDLLLIVFKVNFASEGEAFHHGGKLDFKVTNTANRYEFVTGELKWWDRDEAARKVFSQLVREHATGQEAALFCLMLSRNRDALAVDTKVRTLIKAESEFEGEWTACAPQGSNEAAYSAHVRVRGRSIPLYFLLANLDAGMATARSDDDPQIGL